MDIFTQEIHDAISEEQNDSEKYEKLSEEAPNEKIKKILLDISHEEQIHKKFLIEILSELA